VNAPNGRVDLPLRTAEADDDRRRRLFDDAFLRTLEAFRFAPRSSLTGLASGQRRSPAFGSSVEFADYRTYTPGDDYRRIDWNAYARLERLFLRRYRADENLALSIVLDASASMSWGEPSKARCAAQIAGALTFVGLRSEDAVSLLACRNGVVADNRARLSGQVGVFEAWRFLERLSFEGETDLDASLTAYARRIHGRGMALVISDLLSPAGFQKGVDALLGAGQEVVLLQVLAPDELNPPADMVGDWRLVDAERGDGLDVTITPRLIASYREKMKRYLDDIVAYCRQRGVTHILMSSDVDLRDVLVRTLRQAGVLA
jgi:uncharacterized protein (DUF58 family)